jgi:NADPH2:quinone reductase
MKAIIYTEYGSPEVLRLAEVEKPVPQDNQVLIRIHATTAAVAEVMERKGESVIGRIILGFRKPRKRFRILGLELAGEIESVGKAVTRFKKGDQVYGFTGFRLGAYAEYICIPEKG